MICSECQSFRGTHQHYAQYHDAACSCSGQDHSRIPYVDADAQFAVRMAEGVDLATEQETDKAFIRPETVWRPLSRRVTP